MTMNKIGWKSPALSYISIDYLGQDYKMQVYHNIKWCGIQLKAYIVRVHRQIREDPKTRG